MLAKFKELIPQMELVKDETADFYEYILKNCNVTKKVDIALKYDTVKKVRLVFTEKCLESFYNDSMTGDIEDIYKCYEIYSAFICCEAILNLAFEDDDFTEENYNLFKNSGLDNYLYMTTGGTYLNMLTLCDRVIGINNLNIIQQLNEVFAHNPSIDEFNEAIVKMDTVLGKDEISKNFKFMKDIERFNDPNLAKIIDTISTIEDKKE